MSDLPAHLQEFWKGADPRTSPAYCAKQSRKTPAIPWHNGVPVCLSCGARYQGPGLPWRKP